MESPLLRHAEPSMAIDVLSVLLVIVGLLSVLGLLLLKRGLLPRRRGDEPYCQRCGYNLTALTSQRCPECGSVIQARSVVRGRRYRSPGRAVAGILCLAPAMLIGVGAWRSIDWYHYLPANLLLIEIERSNAASAQRAVREVVRRESNGRLAPEHYDRFIKLCLAEQRSSALRPVTEDLLRHLAGRFHSGALLPWQQEEFLNHYVHLELRVRPQVLRGEPVPWDLQIVLRRVSGRIRTEVSEGEACLNREPISLLQSDRLLFHGYRAEHNESWVQDRFWCEQLGRHRFSKLVSVHLVDLLTGARLHSRTVRLQAEFEVVDEETEPAAGRSMPSLKQEIQKRIAPADFTCSMANYITGRILIQELPVDVAFDVFARTGGQEFPLGSVSAERGRVLTIDNKLFRFGGWYSGPPVDRFDLILRSSSRAARRSTRIVEFWEGELVYRDVPINSYWFGSPYFGGRSDI